MSDAITIARAGVPTVALITDRFAEQGHMLAAARGMPGLPQVRLPYPIAGTGAASVARVARESSELILGALGVVDERRQPNAG